VRLLVGFGEKRTTIARPVCRAAEAYHMLSTEQSPKTLLVVRAQAVGGSEEHQ
jgi:hypothetical protein